MDQIAQLYKLEGPVWGLDLSLQCIDNELDWDADIKDWELLVREDWLQLWLNHQVVDSIDLKVPMLEPVHFGWKKWIYEQTLPQVDWFAILCAKIVFEGTFGGVDPIRWFNFLWIKLSKGICCSFEMVLKDHLVVYFVLWSDKLAFCLLDLQVKHVYILSLGEVPAQVLVNKLDCIVDHVAICSEAHCIFRVSLRLTQELI